MAWFANLEKIGAFKAFSGRNARFKGQGNVRLSPYPLSQNSAPAMIQLSGHHHPEMPNGSEQAAALVRAVVEISDGRLDLAGRRQRLLAFLAKQLGAISGHWGWACGSLDSDQFMPVAFSFHGYTPEQLVALDEFISQSDHSREFFRRLQVWMGNSHRSDGGWIVNSKNELADIVGQEDSPIYQSMKMVGVGHWLQAGKFIDNRAFSMIVLGRTSQSPEFSDADAAFLDFAFTHVSWFHARPDESVPQEKVVALSPRQREVARLLVTGLSRKQIAAKLGISSETVAHHVKAIFRHFDIHSATELAALFLRNQ